MSSFVTRVPGHLIIYVLGPKTCGVDRFRTAFVSVLRPSADPDNSLTTIATSQQFILCLVYGQSLSFARH